MRAGYTKYSPWLPVSILSIRTIPTLLSILTLLALLIPPAAQAQPWVMSPNEFHSDLRGSFFSTETFLDATGERPVIANGGVYEARAIAWSTELGWKKRMSFKFDIPFESVTRQFSPGVESSRAGLSDLLVGFKYAIMTGSTALALEADWKAPMGYNKRLVPALGNGRQEGIGLVHLGTAFEGLGAFVQLAGGYRAQLEPSVDPALPKDEILAGADLGWWLSRTLLLSGSYRGRIEAKEALRPVTQHLVGPQLRYRVDDHLDVFAGSMHTASGKNVLHVDQFYAGIATKKTGLGRLQGFLGSTKGP